MRRTDALPYCQVTNETPAVVSDVSVGVMATAAAVSPPIALQRATLLITKACYSRLTSYN